MDSRESYEFVKKLTDCGMGIMEMRCWVEFPGPDGAEIVAFGCGSFFRFMLGSTIMCPFCGCRHYYTTPEKGKTYWDLYPVTPRFTGEWGTITAEEEVKRDRVAALAAQKGMEFMAAQGRKSN